MNKDAKFGCLLGQESGPSGLHLQQVSVVASWEQMILKTFCFHKMNA